MFAYLNTKVTDLDSCDSFGNLETDIHVVEKCEPLFARIDEKKFMEEFNKEKEAAKKEEPKKEEKVEEVTIDDFAKSCGEMQIIFDPQMSEWGNPVRRTRIIHTPIHNVWRGTR